MWLEFTVNGQKLAIGTAYIPQWVGLDIFIDALTESINSFSTCNHIILLGDFNVDLLSLDNCNTKKVFEFPQYMDLQQYVTQATHFTDHSGTLIDLVCSNVKISNVDVDHVANLSHHDFISCDIHVKKSKPLPKCINFRPIRNINLDYFNRDVEAVAWDRLICENVNDSVNSLFAYVLHLFNVHAPPRAIYIKDHNYLGLLKPFKIL